MMLTRRALILAAGPLAVRFVNAEPPGHLFAFRTGFWLNLHHFLYVLGRARNKTSDSTRGPVVGAPADRGNGEALTAAWENAVAVYSRTISRQDVLFDSEASATTSRAAAIANSATLPDDFDARIREALLAAAPDYRRVWWPGHSESNRRRIGELEALVDLYGQAIEQQITRAYQEPWPASGFTIDVCAYSVWAGAYSTSRGLIVFASTDPAMAGTQGLESIFHESMHQWDDHIEGRIADVARDLRVRTPNQFSHSLIFYTAGYATAHVVPGHQPHAKVNGLWAPGSFLPIETLDRYWLPYLEGKGTIDDALRGLLSA